MHGVHQKNAGPQGLSRPSADVSAGRLRAGDPLGVYVHFPFCSVRCPYCKEMQLEEHHHRMPLWFIITAVLLILITIAYYVFGMGDGTGFLHW